MRRSMSAISRTPHPAKATLSTFGLPNFGGMSAKGSYPNLREQTTTAESGVAFARA